jgi:hypothetical protein
VFAAFLCREAPLLHCQPTCFLSLLSIAASSTMEGTSVEYSETTTVTLEWTLPGLKSIFESRFEPALVVRISVLMHKSSKGDTKSKVTKSARFVVGKSCFMLIQAQTTDQRMLHTSACTSHVR